MLHCKLDHILCQQGSSKQQRLTFRAEPSGLRKCSSACPALCAGWRCRSGPAPETSAAARFPGRRFSEELE